MTLIFILTAGLCLSSYIFYPAVIYLAGYVWRLNVGKEDICPSISIIIPAYNESKNIERKIINTLALDYPRDKVEILIGSDGSDDATPELAAHFGDHRIQCYDFKKNRGKTAVQNDLVKESKGHILIFTDAASFLQPDAIKKIVRNFADDRVGCVAGRMRFIDTGANMTTQSQGLYWKYEVKIRELESRLGRLIGVDGPLYAMKREAYRVLEPDIISDFISPLLVLNQGKKVVFEPEGLVDEAPTGKTRDEFKTRRRITLRALIGLARHAELINPLKHPYLSFQIFFHKIIRWFIGPLVMLNVLTSWALSGHWVFKSILVTYLIFFVAAAAGWAAGRLGSNPRLLTVPYYFTLVNLAAFAGIIDFLRKRQVVTWRPVRH